MRELAVAGGVGVSSRIKDPGGFVVRSVGISIRRLTIGFGLSPLPYNGQDINVRSVAQEEH